MKYLNGVLKGGDLSTPPPYFCTDTNFSIFERLSTLGWEPELLNIESDDWRRLTRTPVPLSEVSEWPANPFAQPLNPETI